MVIASFLFPGFGQALVHRPVRAFAWAGAAIVSLLALVLTMWMALVAILVRLASAADAARVMRRDARPGGLDRRLGAILVVIGASGFGLTRLCVEAFRIPSSSMFPTIEIGDHVFVDKLTIRWRPVARGELVVFRYPCNPSVVFVKRAIAIGGDTVEVRCDVVYVNGVAVPHRLVAKEWEYEDRDEASGDWMRQKVSRYHEELGGHAFDVFEALGEPGERDFPRLDAPFAPGCADSTLFRGPARAHDVKGTFATTKAGAGTCEPQRVFQVPKGAVFMLGDNRGNAADSRYWGPVREADVLGRVVGVWSNSVHGSAFARFGDLQ